MSNLILNDNVIGGSSNDSSDILYTPNDNRAETNVQDELDRINTDLSDTLSWKLIGSGHSQSIPAGANELMVVVSYTNTSNLNWTYTFNFPNVPFCVTANRYFDGYNPTGNTVNICGISVANGVMTHDLTIVDGQVVTAS